MGAEGDLNMISRLSNRRPSDVYHMFKHENLLDRSPWRCGSLLPTQGELPSESHQIFSASDPNSTFLHDNNTIFC